MAVGTTCWRCKTAFWLPDELHTAARASEDVWFFCPYGHKAHFAAGETEADKLRRERDRLTQQLAQKDDSIRWNREARETAERRVSALKGVATRMRNRAAAGLCPCCNRTVRQLADHMKSQHPDYGNQDVEGLKVIAGGKR